MAALLREDIRLLAVGWSEWKRAMVNVDPGTVRYETEPRGSNQVGFICSSIRNAFPDEAEHCGIYEWQARFGD